MPVFSRFRRNRLGIVVQIWGLGGLAAAIWLLSVFAQSRPDVLGLDAPATQFSAARADAVLGDQAPHPSGSPVAEAVPSQNGGQTFLAATIAVPTR